MAPKNFIQVLLRNFSVYAEAPAMMFKRQGSYRTISYRDLEGISLSVASNLIRAGLRPRDRIAILSQNRPEWAYADLGSLIAGAITSAIYATSLPEEAAFIIQDLEASILFVEDVSQLKKILEVRDRIPTVRKVFVFEETFENPDDSWVRPFSALLQGDDPIPELRARVIGVVVNDFDYETNYYRKGYYKYYTAYYRSDDEGKGKGKLKKRARKLEPAVSRKEKGLIF